MRTRAAQVESGDRHAVVGVSEHRAGRKQLIERQRTVEDVAVRQAEDALPAQAARKISAVSPARHSCGTYRSRLSTASCALPSDREPSRAAPGLEKDVADRRWR